MSTENEQSAEVLRGLIKGWAYSLPESRQWEWLRKEMLTVAGEATAASVYDAGIDVETRSVQRADVRTGRSEYGEERTRWVVVVEREDEETAAEYRSTKDNLAGSMSEARTLRDVLEKRGVSAVVAVGEVVERRKIVERFKTGSHISVLNEPSSLNDRP